MLDMLIKMNIKMLIILFVSALLSCNAEDISQLSSKETFLKEFKRINEKLGNAYNYEVREALIKIDRPIGRITSVNFYFTPEDVAQEKKIEDTRIKIEVDTFLDSEYLNKKFIMIFDNGESNLNYKLKNIKQRSYPNKPSVLMATFETEIEYSIFNARLSMFIDVGGKKDLLFPSYMQKHILDLLTRQYENRNPNDASLPAFHFSKTF